MDDRAAELSKLYKELGPDIWTYAVRKVGQGHDADEVLQDTFVVAARGFNAVQSAVSPKAWLIGIARKVIQERARRARSHRFSNLREDFAAAPADQADWRVEEMRNAISRLPEAQRDVLELRLESQLSYAEIAETLEIPVGTVRSRLHNAILSLREWAADGGRAALKTSDER